MPTFVVIFTQKNQMQWISTVRKNMSRNCHFLFCCVSVLSDCHRMLQVSLLYSCQISLPVEFLKFWSLPMGIALLGFHTCMSFLISYLSVMKFYIKCWSSRRWFKLWNWWYCIRTQEYWSRIAGVPYIKLIPLNTDIWKILKLLNLRNFCSLVSAANSLLPFFLSRPTILPFLVLPVFQMSWNLKCFNGLQIPLWHIGDHVSVDVGFWNPAFLYTQGLGSLYLTIVDYTVA